MTSPTANQTQTPASNNSTTPSSYASAAGATKKPTATPVVAPGSNAPVVATGTSGSAPQHAKSSSISPMNGRPNIMPAIPTIPTVVHSTPQSANGLTDHTRKSSVTISANGPNSYSTNGGTAAGKANIKFGFESSPAVLHSSPQPGSAPIPIPDTNPRVTSPQNPPSPIPQPSASGGGRPPSGTAQQSMTFGSFGGDSDRPHMRATSVSQDPNALGSQHSPHTRRGSNVSDMSNQGPPHMGRGGFPSGGRGRGYANSYNQNMGYPPNYGRGPQNSGRGGMAPNYGNARQQPFGTPPPQHRSPALPPAMPHHGMGPQGIPPPFYYPGMGGQIPQQGYYPGQFDPNMRPGMPVAGYQMYPVNQSPAPTYQQPYTPGPYNPPGAQPMSRNSSQVSMDHRPTSSTGQNQAPVISQGTPQLPPAQIKPAVVASPQFNRPPKKSMAITIKNAAGETVDLSKITSPAPSSQQSKTPPVIASTPTPPPKTATPRTSTPAHSRAESVSNSKTAEEVRNEFKEKMKQAASGDKAKEDEAAKAAAEKAKEEERLKAEQKAQEEAKAAEEAKARQEAEEKEKAEREAAEAAKAAKAEPKKEEAPKADEPDDEELERIIREMEEEDARREKQEEERRIKIEAEKAAKKAEEEANRLKNAAENDRKLREAEAEMERLEEERERRRAQENSKGSVQDLIKQSLEKQADKPDTTSASEATAKMANLSLGDKPSASAGGKSAQGGRGPKPAALNLAPINTKSVEPSQPSAALQSLKTARLLGSNSIKADLYPPGIQSPNPALNAAVARKGTSFKYDSAFLLQFQKVFTEQPSVDFHQQVKTLIGDSETGRSASARTPAGVSNRQNSRGGAGGATIFGSFSADGRTLPPGTTSAQRFGLAGGDKSMSRPPMNPIGSFRGAFPGGNQMARTPSSSNMSLPHSPRQGSRRNASKQNTFNAKAEAQAAKTMPLTQGMKIEALSTSATGWKPSSIAKAPAAPAPGAPVAGNTLLDPSMVQRKVKAALNKMTPENFDRISDQILQIAGQSKDETDGRTLRQVIQLTFEKATDEAHWASMYAKFCKRMLEMMSPEIRDENIKDRTGQVVSGGALFRKYLLNRCQEEFERGWKVSLPEPKEGGDDKKTLEAAMLSDEYYIAAAAKRRGLGLVQFIGELYKLGMLTERIMHECVKKLVDYQGVPDEAEVESLSKLLRTIGANLDSTDKGRAMMDAYFTRIQGMIDLPDLPSRLKFMLMDVIDLRKANWVSKEANKGPKTLEEVRAEAEAQAAQKAAEAARTSQRGGGGGPGGRPQMGRGDARNFSGYAQQAQNQVGMDDLRRLKGGANRTSSSGVTLGPMSMLGSRSNSGRRLGPGGSLSRGAEDSGASSRTGTPPVREAQSSTNSFGLLANMDSENPASPPSTAASPALTKAVPDTVAASEKGGS